MILDDVAQRSCTVIIGAALAFHSDAFGNSDLNVVNIGAIENGLEDQVSESKCQDILNRFLAEIVIDAKDLVFVQHPFDRFVQFNGAGQVMPEWFFKDDSNPGTLIGLMQ